MRYFFWRVYNSHPWLWLIHHKIRPDSTMLLKILTWIHLNYWFLVSNANDEICYHPTCNWSIVSFFRMMVTSWKRAIKTICSLIRLDPCKGISRESCVNGIKSRILSGRVDKRRTHVTDRATSWYGGISQSVKRVVDLERFSETFFKFQTNLLE